MELLIWILFNGVKGCFSTKPDLIRAAEYAVLLLDIIFEVLFVNWNSYFLGL